MKISAAFLLRLVLLLPLVLRSGAVLSETCASADVEMVNHGDSQTLDCSLPGNYRWWKSDNNCSSFVAVSPDCPNDQSCTFVVDEANERYYQFCCTNAGVSELMGSTVTDAQCFYIQVCTKILNVSEPIVAFFDRLVTVEVEMYAEPIPGLHDDTMFELELPNATIIPQSLPEPVTHFPPSTSRVILVYYFRIAEPNPLVESAIFTLNLAYSSCGDRRETCTVTFPVAKAPPLLEDNCTNVPVTASPAPVVDCDTNLQYLIPMIVFIATTAFFFSSSIVLLLLVIRAKMLYKRIIRTSPPSSHSYAVPSEISETPPGAPRRPHSLPYNRQTSNAPLLNSDGSANTTPIVATPHSIVSSNSRLNTPNIAMPTRLPTIDASPEMTASPAPKYAEIGGPHQGSTRARKMEDIREGEEGDVELDAGATGGGNGYGPPEVYGGLKDRELTAQSQSTV